MYYSTTHPSPVGLLTLASDGDHLMGLWIEGQKYHGCSIPDAMAQRDDVSVFSMAKNWLDKYFAGKQPDISALPLAPHGSDFRKSVWNILCEIPYGAITTYGDIAKRMARVMNKESLSAQAVGGAVGHNPISIIIPCHRVVGTNGSLTGYAGGIDIKKRLLELEGAPISALFVHKSGTAL